ncbi:unnamed protein product [Meloidogyne enterolobii]|uniref:Uncharacterized protein n=1 Tax=Meloidogyne enterolobii TaxID=390850 RepID=A0ACB1AVC0_MELEN
MHKTTYTEAHHLLAKFWKDYNKIVEGENKNSLEHNLSKSKPFGFLEKALAEHKRKVKNHVKELEDHHHKKNVGEHVKEIEDHHKKNTNKEPEKSTKEDKAEPSERKEEVDDENTPLLGKEHDNQVSEVEEILGEENAPLAGKEHGRGEIAEGITKEIDNLDKHVKDLREKNVEVHKYISYHSYFYTFSGQSGQESVCIQDLYLPKIFA